MAEMQARGIEVPPEIREQIVGVRKNFVWPEQLSKLSDGKPFNPLPQQKGFIDSLALFVGYIGGRGCVSSDTLIGNIPIAELTNNWNVVPTIFGNSVSSPSYIKGQNDLYKIKSPLGSQVKATLHHHILTITGWNRLQDLTSDCLVIFDDNEHDDVQRETNINCLGRYSSYFHQYGELPVLLVQDVLNILQQFHSIVYDNNAQLDPFHLSIVSSLIHLLLLFFEELGFSLMLCGLPLPEQLQPPLLYLHSLIQNDKDQSKIHQKPEFFDFSFPYQSNFRSIYNIYSLDSKKSQILSQQPLNFHASVQQQQFQESLDSVQFSFLLKAVEFLLFSLWEYPILSIFSLRSLYHNLDILLQKQSFEYLYKVHELSQSVRLSGFFSSKSPTDYYNTSVGVLKDISFSNYGDYYDLQVPYGNSYNSSGLIHHNSGKSATASQKVMQKIKDGQSGAVMNPDFENFKISTWPELRDWIPWDFVIPKHKHRRNKEWFPQQPFIHVFENGASIICKGLKEPDSARGPNINFLWYDEFGRDETGEAFRIAVPSVRIGKDPQIYLTGTPNGDDHWGSKLLIDQEFPDEVVEALKEIGGDRKIVETFRGSTYDNRTNLDASTYAMILTMYPPGTWLYEQEILGNVVSHGGVLGNRAWFENHIIARPPENVNGRLRYWDLAATEKKIVKKSMLDPDETVGTLMSYQKNEHLDFFIEHQKCGFWEWDELKENIYQTALSDGPSIKQIFEQEPGSGGKNQVAELINWLQEKLPGWIRAEGHNPRDNGDKVMRANIWFAEAANKQFWMVYGDWNEPFLKQLASFPISKHDDKIDSVSGARIKLAPIFTWRKIPFMKV